MRLMPTSPISLYEEMNALSSRMAAAARIQDWETLKMLARSVAVLRNALPDGDSQLTEAELQQKTVLIQRILDDDAEIRRHTEPWMERVCDFLNPPPRRSKHAQRQARAC
ncbi:FliT flagellar protein (modular protein) [Sterolibacterium denitrificans]|uniref:Flagellar protein FliT n=3 Tax=Sterolibacterium denitrificans TaxID=157592 RepID=A0A7Z7HTG6_9PROT|nr:FliT flagellar protein (modular protein) [Sterolibacterium denitrificans]